MRFFVLAIIVSLLLSCGSREEGNSDFFLNTTVATKIQAESFTAKKALPGQVNIMPIAGIRPISGTVSHHLLCSSVINEWFSNLKKLRNVETFIIISPNHSRLGMKTISLTRRNWHTVKIVTETNRGKVDKIIQGLKTNEDNGAFVHEHGVEALLPFISHYFPQANIVPILVDEKHKQMTLIKKLSTILYQMMNKNRDIFLLISADFSHKGNRKQTRVNDSLSYEALLNFGKGKRAVSDNNSGLMIMFNICKEMNIRNIHFFCHTDSEKFAPENKENITSYFFTYQY